MPAPTSSRLTLAPGDYSRGRTRPVPFARAFSRAFVSRLRHRAGIGPGPFAAIPSFRPGKEANTRTCEQGRTSLVRLFAENPGITPGSGFQTAAFSLAAEKEQPTARVPGAGGCIVLFLLRPLNAGRRLFPRKRHADGFGATFCHQKVAIRRGTRRGSVFSTGD